MMGKRAAEALARTGTLTWGDLRRMVERPCDRSDVCPLNPTVTMGYCQDLYGELTGKRDATEIPQPRPSRDFLLVTNLLQIFGPPRDMRPIGDVVRPIVARITK